MEADEKHLPQPVVDEHFAIGAFFSQVVKEIEDIQAQREAAYQKAMQPLPEEDE